MKKILVIDDEEWLREMVRMALTTKGYVVLEAPNGSAGIEIARRSLPDLILCDVNMEKVDGYLTLSSLRNEPSTASIPFILMTGMADHAGMRHGMELGADDYLPKPFTLDTLYAAVNTRLKKADAVREAAEKKLADLRDNISLMLPHELRTPLNGIIAYGEILTQEAHTLPPDEVSEMGQVIYHSGRRLERLVENFLVYAQIEILSADPQKVAALKKARTELPLPVIEEAARTQAHSLRREADLVLDLAPVEMAIAGDYLRRIVSELVENAFKFSSPGTAVQVRLTSDAQGVSLSVTDQGRGFSTEHITRIGAYMQFERRVHEQQGLGLGLIISKRLAELHGGTLNITSERGATTEVLLRIPRAGHSGHTVTP
jgi:signal transduction histidine kinase